jgi:hypothetical protein
MKNYLQIINDTILNVDKLSSRIESSRYEYVFSEKMRIINELNGLIHRAAVRGHAHVSYRFISEGPISARIKKELLDHLTEAGYSVSQFSASETHISWNLSGGNDESMQES